MTYPPTAKELRDEYDLGIKPSRLHTPETFGKTTWGDVFHCAPDCDDRANCEDWGTSGHESCGRRRCGCPRHHHCQAEEERTTPQPACVHCREASLKIEKLEETISDLEYQLEWEREHPRRTHHLISTGEMGQ